MSAKRNIYQILPLHNNILKMIDINNCTNLKMI